MRLYEHMYDFLIITSIYPIATENQDHKSLFYPTEMTEQPNEEISLVLW
jgi:hypothetical protein